MRQFIFACVLVLLVMLLIALGLHRCQVQRPMDSAQSDTTAEGEQRDTLIELEEVQELLAGVDTANDLADEPLSPSNRIEETSVSGGAGQNNMNQLSESSGIGSGLLTQGGAGSIEIVYPSEPAEVELDLTLIDAMRLPEADVRRTLVGMWTQSGGSATPDFGPGGYSQSTLVFRTDGVLEIVRFYGNHSEVRIDSVLDYQITSDGQLALGNKPEFVRGATMPIIAGSWGPTGPPRFPMTLRYSMDLQTLVLDGKRYRPRSSDK